MVYTSGTSGRPKGVRRALTGEDPDRVPPASTWFFGLFGLKPFDDHVHLCCSPLYHTAVLNFATISLQLGHPVVLMDRFDPETMLALVERHRVTHSHMVPTQFRRLLALPEEVRARYDVSSLRLHDPRRRAVPAGGQAADAGLVGAGRDRVLRGDRGRRQRHHRAGVARPAGIGRHAPGPVPRCGSSTTTATTCRPGSPASSTCGWAPPPSTTTRTGTRPSPPAPGACSPSATSATSTRTATSTCAIARAT